MLLAGVWAAASPCDSEDEVCLLASATVSLLQTKLEVHTEADKFDEALTSTGVLLQMKAKAKTNPKPMFTEKTMPAVSTTLKCIMNLTYLYFGLYTALMIVRTFGKNRGLGSILETGCTTVTYAPMLGVLFLGARLRALQLSQGKTEEHHLPQPWVQDAMETCTYAISAQVILVLLVGVMSGASNITTDADGNLDTSKMDSHPIVVKVLTLLRYLAMLALYGGFSTVVGGIFVMQGPKEIWGDAAPPVSPAVGCTMLLTAMFFVVYLLVAVTKTIFELSPGLRSSKALLKLEASAGAAKMTVNFAPMLAILLIGARMRALQIDPKLGNPQPWAQKAFFACTFSILAQAILALVLPFATDAECKRGDCEGDVSFVMKNKVLGAVLEIVRYACLLALYAGIVTVIYSILVIQNETDPSLTPPLAPALSCTISLTVQYFLIYTLLFVCITIKSFVLDQAGDSPVSQVFGKAISIFDAARATVMFAPMLAVLCMGCRMRAQQLATAEDGSIPEAAGPQLWAQQCMQLATGAVFIQLVMTMVVPILTRSGKPECDADGNVKMPSGSNKFLAMFVELIRYATLICMYIGASAVCFGVVVMTPETVQPYQVVGILPAGIVK